MSRKAIITISLIDESSEKSCSEIEKEMLAELSKNSKIPWCKKIEKVQVTQI